MAHAGCEVGMPYSQIRIAAVEHTLMDQHVRPSALRLCARAADRSRGACSADGGGGVHEACAAARRACVPPPPPLPPAALPLTPRAPAAAAVAQTSAAAAPVSTPSLPASSTSAGAARGGIGAHPLYGAFAVPPTGSLQHPRAALTSALPPALAPPSVAPLLPPQLSGVTAVIERRGRGRPRKPRLTLALPSGAGGGSIAGGSGSGGSSGDGSGGCSPARAVETRAVLQALPWLAQDVATVEALVAHALHSTEAQQLPHRHLLSEVAVARAVVQGRDEPAVPLTGAPGFALDSLRTWSSLDVQHKSEPLPLRRAPALRLHMRCSCCCAFSVFSACCCECCCRLTLLHAAQAGCGWSALWCARQKCAPRCISAPRRAAARRAVPTPPHTPAAAAALLGAGRARG